MLIGRSSFGGIIGIDDHAVLLFCRIISHLRLLSGKTVLVTAHGNSLRALIKYLE